MFFLFLLFLIAAGFLARMVIGTYNRLQRAGEEVREAHSNIIVSMKKRIDLANKLIDIARSYGDHEKLTHISIARADGQSDSAVIAASAEAAGAVQTVLRLATHYPELKASDTYNLLMHQLEDVESNLQNRRERYNSLVKAYNSQLSQIPTNLFAPALGFHAAPYFNVDDADSLEGLKGFATADGEILRTMLADAGRRMKDGSLEVGRRVVDTSREVGQKAAELGRDAVEKGKEAADRYQATRPGERPMAPNGPMQSTQPMDYSPASPPPPPTQPRDHSRETTPPPPPPPSLDYSPSTTPPSPPPSMDYSRPTTPPSPPPSALN